MAIVRWALLAVVASVAVGTWWVALAGEAPAAGEARFYCPMHPEIRSAEPGTCPICYMRLEPIPHEHLARGEHGEHGDAGMPEPTEASEASELGPVMLTLERRQTAGIATVAVARRSVRDVARWPAIIEAQEGARAEVRMRTDAFVERLAIRASGVRVRAGQPLAWVYAPAILQTQEELLAARRWRTGSSGQADTAALAEAAARERLLLLGATPRDVDAAIAAGR
ncbi:MAG: efflux RND transporter periplasmic adaptor subunit, partial [Sandaracinaceae bacterium]|nr:efflux RND transporter periplasmic adaptor subunit [Sandaracinaceae bacterium]